MALALGHFTNAWAWAYFVYLRIFFIVRDRIDDGRCALKYGELWTQYRAKTRYRLVPKEAQAQDGPPGLAHLSHRVGQHQLDALAVDGCCQNPIPGMHFNGLLVDFDERVAQSMDVSGGCDFVDHLEARERANAPEFEAAAHTGAVDRQGTDRRHVAVAVYVGQVAEVHGVLSQRLNMPRKPEGPEAHLARLGSVGRYVRQAQLRRPAAVFPPVEDHPEDFLGLVELQRRGFRGRGIRSGDALAVRVELQPVKGADQAAVANLAANRGPEVRVKMRTHRIRHADAVVLVAPDDDFLARPGLLDQSLAQNRIATPDELPALGERGQISYGIRRASVCLREHIPPPPTSIPATI